MVPPDEAVFLLILNLAAGMKAGYAFPGRPVPPPPAIARVPAARGHCPGMFSRSLRTGRPSEMSARRARAAKVNVLARLTSTLQCGKCEQAAQRAMAKREKKGEARRGADQAGQGRPAKGASEYRLTGRIPFPIRKFGCEVSGYPQEIAIVQPRSIKNIDENWITSINCN